MAEETSPPVAGVDAFDDSLEALAARLAGQEDAADSRTEATFTLTRVERLEKPPLAEALIEPAGGDACACNAVCTCVPVDTCACFAVCQCDTVATCASHVVSGCYPIVCTCNVIYI